MSKSAEVHLAQLETSLNFMIGLLEEGSLVPRYHESTRRELAEVLRHLLKKVDGLPEGVPENLVQATAVRAVIEASEKYNIVEQEERFENLSRHLREVEIHASLHGHTLTPWEKVSGSNLEYQASCEVCGGFVYVSDASTYNLLLDTCERL